MTIIYAIALLYVGMFLIGSILWAINTLEDATIDWSDVGDKLVALAAFIAVIMWAFGLI